jgi:outer membrane protein
VSLRWNKLARKTAIAVSIACCSAPYAQSQTNSAQPEVAVQALARQSQAQQTNPLTLPQAEALALRNNPQITIGKLRALEAQQYVRETRSARLPTAFLSLTGVDSESGSRIAAGGLNNPVVFPRAAAGATVSQLITDFGRTTNLVSSSQLQAKAEDQNAAATRADVTLAVDRSFYNCLETRELVKVAQSTVDARQLLVDKVQALTNAKLRSDLDLSFTKVDLSRAKLLLLEAQSNQQTCLASLSALLGFQDQQTFDLFEPAQPQPLAPPVPDAQPFILQALQQRPELAALQYQVESAHKTGSAEHDLWRPTIGALGVAGIAPVRDPAIPNWYGAVGVNINIPVFNGFLYNARAKTADLQTEVARQKLSDLRNNIARDVRIAWEDTHRAYQRLGVTRQLREQAGLALDLAQTRYNLGLASIVEFSQAELAKTEADIADTDANYQYRLTQLTLAYTIGAPK